MLIIILILLHLCSFLLSHLYLLFHLTAPYKLSLEISRAETTDLIAQHLAGFSLPISDTVRGSFFHERFWKGMLQPFAIWHTAKKAKAPDHWPRQAATEILLSKTAPLLLHCACAGGRVRRVPEAVFILISLHTLKANLPIINMQHMLA